jgi:hypothetical protein
MRRVLRDIDKDLGSIRKDYLPLNAVLGRGLSKGARVNGQSYQSAPTWMRFYSDS